MEHLCAYSGIAYEFVSTEVQCAEFQFFSLSLTLEGMQIFATKRVSFANLPANQFVSVFIVSSCSNLCIFLAQEAIA